MLNQERDYERSSEIYRPGAGSGRSRQISLMSHPILMARDLGNLGRADKSLAT